MAITVPLAPPEANFTGLRAGDRNLILVTVKTAKDGVPIDLTGQTITAQARTKNTDLDPVMTAVIEVLDAVNGELSLRWPGDQVTIALDGKPTWKGVWDLQADNGVEDPVTLCAGTLTAEQDVTR